ncbi:hypothetical protein HPP92_003089 [Vanilla planifolia]|uniref:Uncharacterized protein n=1 Tax=Vanilla planifolia TaxID=51239 RepID=A0A835VL59_VANPL|nr:hypothetical protein HPP92_003089 [Vanilla planifolia]
MTARRWRKRVKWLVRLKGPVSHRPEGTTSMLPPEEASRLRWEIASRNALVFEVTPSPTALNSVSSTTWTRRCPTADRLAVTTNKVIATVHKPTR